MNNFLNLNSISVLSVTIGVIGVAIYSFAFSNIEYKGISLKASSTSTRSVIAFFGILLLVIGADGIAP